MEIWYVCKDAGAGFVEKRLFFWRGFGRVFFKILNIRENVI